jgi:protein-S-isoprenylcysteine O-methyltransferase Ste14
MATQATGVEVQAVLAHVAGVVVALCTAAVLAGVLVSFLGAPRGREVRAQRRGPVATGSMLLFLLAFYLLVHYRVGALAIESEWLQAALMAVGLLLVVLGCVVNLLGRAALGRNWSDQAAVYSTQTLVTGGVYALARHPLYASLIWMFCGASLAFANWAALLATVLVFTPAMYYRARLEEVILCAQFPEYAAYTARTGMFGPLPLPALPTRQVVVSAAGFRTCRFVTAALLWAAYFTHSVWLLAAALVLLALNALLGIRRAPLVALYTATLGRLWPGAAEQVDESGLRFGHSVAACAVGVSAWIIGAAASPAAGWTVVMWVAIFKTAAAVAGCPVSSMWSCLARGGTCCSRLTPGRRGSAGGEG